MTGRKSAIAVVVVFALALCALTSVGAQAEEPVWGCAEHPEAKFFWTDAHCKVESAGGSSGHFQTEFVPVGGVTTITGSNTKTAAETTAAAVSKLKGKLSGVETEVQCSLVSATGELTNTETSVSGTGTISYSGCKVTLPAGRGCVVKAEAITTAKLKVTTVGQAEKKVKFEPNTGTEFAKVSLEGCKENKPPAAEYPVSGSLVASMEGATLFTSHAEITAQGKLNFGGSPAGLDGPITMSMKEGPPILLMKH